MSRETMEYDVIIVGGGPSGSMAAYEIAKAGFSVCIFEKDRDIGYPVRCGEAIGYHGLNQYFKPKKTWIAAEIKGATLVSPKDHRVNVDFKNETGKYPLNYIKDTVQEKNNRKKFSQKFKNLIKKRIEIARKKLTIN